VGHPGKKGKPKGAERTEEGDKSLTELEKKEKKQPNLRGLSTAMQTV
jgi:hypothetical protein